MKNLHCPRHNDRTPSVTVYSNGAWCHAGCKFIPLSELGLKPEDVQTEERYVENVEATLAMVDLLPREPYRGFVLPTDGISSYIVWEDRSYYKRRMYSGTPKYTGPCGVQQPAFWARRGTSSTLLVCEGEFDSLSAALALEEVDILSPGSSSNFNKKLLPSLKPYSNIYIIADDDPAGIEAVIGLGALIMNELHGVPFKRILKSSGEKDFNDILIEQGREALRAHILGLLSA